LEKLVNQNEVESLSFDESLSSTTRNGYARV
jgi:hypothetical protein